MSEPEIPTLTIKRPHVPYGPKSVPTWEADADYLDHAARSISGGYAAGGSNVTMTVVNLLHEVATQLRQAGEQTPEPLPLDPEPWLVEAIPLERGHRTDAAPRHVVIDGVTYVREERLAQIRAVAIECLASLIRDLADDDKEIER